MNVLTQPPIINGDVQQQLVQMRSYLYQISRDLNAALDGISPAAVSQQINDKIRTQNGATSQAMNEQAGQLKSLIIKTADTVKAYSDRLVADLSSSYVAQSDFGTFSENIEQSIEAMNGSISQTIADVSAINDYVVTTNGYIRQGIIGYDGATPIIGIVMGQEIAATGTETVDGKTYDVFDMTKNMSVWTTQKLSFYVNGQETAYVSNGAFYTEDIVVKGKLFLGEDQWQLWADPVNGLLLTWIGG